jgi:hypothetical protein
MDDVQPQPPDLKAYADRLEVLCRAQADEIDRLRNVVAKLTGTDDAHSTLRRLYLDEALAPTARVRAAQAALGVEKASLKPMEAPLVLVPEEYESLADRVARMRARADRLRPALLEQCRFTADPSDGGDDSSSND